MSQVLDNSTALNPVISLVSDEEVDDDELQFVSHVKRKRPLQAVEGETAAQPRITRARSTNTHLADGEVECVAERNTVRTNVEYPHFRFQCGVHPYDRFTKASREKFCSKCFCFVCDKPASQCALWTDHATAVENFVWKMKRKTELRKRGKQDARNRGGTNAIARNGVVSFDTMASSAQRLELANIAWRNRCHAAQFLGYYYDSCYLGEEEGQEDGDEEDDEGEGFW